MKNIAEKVKLAKLGDESAMMELIEMWSPLINKFVRLLKYDEDCRSEMIVKLILLVKKEIDLNNINNLNDCTIIQYIRTSLTHYYIALSTGRAKIRNSEISYDDETLINLRERDFSDNMVFTDRLLLDYLRTVLSEREYLCVKLMVIDGLTAESVAKRLGVSKQAVNQCKKRALKKLRKEVENFR